MKQAAARSEIAAAVRVSVPLAIPAPLHHEKATPCVTCTCVIECGRVSSAPMHATSAAPPPTHLPTCDRDVCQSGRSSRYARGGGSSCRSSASTPHQSSHAAMLLLQAVCGGEAPAGMVATARSERQLRAICCSDLLEPKRFCYRSCALHIAALDAPAESAKCIHKRMRSCGLHGPH